MSEKTFNLVVGIVGGLGTIACATVTYMSPDKAPLIVASIGIAETAIIEICSLFKAKALKNK